jgi:cell division initiation protein
MDEVTPEFLRNEVVFPVKLRGYDQEQVDELLDRVADGIELLQQQVRQATERAVRAEQAMVDGAATDEALRRTLVLAQRAADMAIEEAREEATRLRNVAQGEAAELRAAAVADAQRSAGEAQRVLRDDIAALERARDELRTDVEALRRFVDGERARLRDLLAEQLDTLERAGGMQAAIPPPVRDVVVPPEPRFEVDEAPAATATDEEEGDEEEGGVRGWGDIERPDFEADGADDDAEHGVDVTAGAEPAEAEASGFYDQADDGGPSTQPVEILALDDEPPEAEAEDLDEPDEEIAPSDTHDPFFSELRQAFTDDAPLGPRDDSPFADDEHPDLDIPDRPRWGLRRRR